MQTFFDALSQFWGSLPVWVQVLPVLLVGWLLALLLRLMVAGALALLRLDQLAEHSGAAGFLRKGQVTYTPSKLVGAIVFWLVLGGVFAVAARMLDVAIVKVFSQKLAAIMPELIVAALIAILGIVMVVFIANFIVTVARNAGLAWADVAGRVIKWGGMLLVAIVALEQVTVGRTFLGSFALILVGAAAFGTALAFGLGCKDLARDFTLRLITALRERRRAGTKSDLEG